MVQKWFMDQVITYYNIFIIDICYRKKKKNKWKTESSNEVESGCQMENDTFNVLRIYLQKWSASTLFTLIQCSRIPNALRHSVCYTLHFFFSGRFNWNWKRSTNNNNGDGKYCQFNDVMGMCVLTGFECSWNAVIKCQKRLKCSHYQISKHWTWASMGWRVIPKSKCHLHASSCSLVWVRVDW